MHTFPRRLALVLAAQAGGALAQAAPPVTHVTLYPSGATVAREMKVATGTQKVEIACLPAGFDEASLRIEGDADLRVATLRPSSSTACRPKAVDTASWTSASASAWRSVRFVAESQRASTLRLVYEVTHAGWAPAYRASLDSAAGIVLLERQAHIAQATEDWRGVHLTLSTGQPEREVSGTMPQTWSVDIAPAVLAEARRPLPRRR